MWSWQSPSGGSCFYRYQPLQKRSLADTYHAVSALKVFDLVLRTLSSQPL